MDANQADLNIREQVWTHERAASPQSIPQALEALALVSRYQRDEEIYPQQGSRRVLVPRHLGRGKAVRPSGRRAATNRRSLAARRFLWFRGGRQARLRGRSHRRRHRHRALSGLED